jgi:hypothetical protein
LTGEIQTIQQELAEVDQLEAEDKLAHISMIEKMLCKAQGTKRSLRMETRLVADVGQRRQYENRLARLDSRISVPMCKHSNRVRPTVITHEGF